MGNISVFISAGGDKRIVEEVQGCVYAGIFLENNGKIKIRPMCMRVQEQASRQQLRWIIFSGK